MSIQILSDACSRNDLAMPSAYQLSKEDQLLANTARYLITRGVKTPFIMFDVNHIAESAKRWKYYLPDVPAHYAVKANNSPVILNIINKLGLNFDVASVGEMRKLVDLGVSGDQMILSHPLKSDETIEYMKIVRPMAFAVDRVSEVYKLARAGIFSIKDYNPIGLMRLRVPNSNLSTKFGARSYDEMLYNQTVVRDEHSKEIIPGTGELNSDPTRALELCSALKTVGCNSIGVTFHHGTQQHNAEVYRDGIIRVILPLCKALMDVGYPLDLIDIGGGFCDARVAKNKGTSLDLLLSDVSQIVDEFSAEYRSHSNKKEIKIVGEPGRYMVADSGVLVTKARSVLKSDKTAPQLNIEDHCYGSFLNKHHDSREFEFKAFCLDPRKMLISEVREFMVQGDTCDSWDFIGIQRLPANIATDDYFFVNDMGAYTNSAGGPFNDLNPAKVVIYWQKAGKFHFEMSDKRAEMDRKVRSPNTAPCADPHHEVVSELNGLHLPNAAALVAREVLKDRGLVAG